MNIENKMRKALEQIQALTEIPFAHTAGDHELIYQLATEALAEQPVAGVELTDEEILCHALEGFAVSTMYGQGDNKMMPISDSGTLKKFARAVIAAHIAKQDK